MSSLFRNSNRLLAVAWATLGGLAWAQETAAPVPTPGGTSLSAPSAVATQPAEPSDVEIYRLAQVSPLGMAPRWENLAAYADTLSKEEFERAWREVYSQEKSLPPPFSVTPDGVQIPTGDPAEPLRTIPFRANRAAAKPAPERYWRRAAELPALRKRPPLSDLHIALDPGHIGGQWAQMEERFLSFNPGESIREGDMSLQVAQVLAQRLQKLGARVSLVRENAEPVTRDRPENFEKLARETLREYGVQTPLPTYAGVEGDAKIITVQWQAEKLFYRVSEIHARGKRVNENIKPDIVLCLHFNAEAWGNSAAPQFSPKNHLHVLVNGCYSPGELQQQDVRFEMFQRLFQRTHEEEIPLGVAVAEGMARATELPAYIYTTPNARKAGGNAFVYARNLLANRLYQCPVVYLEPYVMNHEETYRRLLAGHYVGRTLIGGKLQTSAMEDYVRGVVDGLVSYYGKERQP